MQDQNLPKDPEARTIVVTDLGGSLTAARARFARNNPDAEVTDARLVGPTGSVGYAIEITFRGETVAERLAR